MIYRLIRDDQCPLSVRRRCKIAEVSVSAYYHWRGQHDGLQESNVLAAAIAAIVYECPAYGYRRVAKELQRRGWQVNKKRVQRLMKQGNLQRKPKRRFIRTTDSNHAYTIYPNLIKDMVPVRPNQIWGADITYVRLLHGFVYLAVILDLFSRKVVGWALSRSLHASIALRALQMAIATRQVPAGLIHHSDRGKQYASEEYIALLKKHGIVISMSRKGNPYDNAKVESFFQKLKTEEIYLNEYLSYDDALHNIGSFIDDVYNAKRLHSSLGYCSPAEYENIYVSNLVA